MTSINQQRKISIKIWIAIIGLMGTLLTAIAMIISANITKPSNGEHSSLGSPADTIKPIASQGISIDSSEKEGKPNTVSQFNIKGDNINAKTITINNNNK